MATGRPTRRTRSTRTARRKLAGEQAARPAFERRAVGRQLAHRPDGLAVRARRATTSRRRSLGRPIERRAAGERAAGGRRRVRHADLRGRRGRGDRRAARSRASSPGPTTSSTGCSRRRADWARYVVGRAGLDGRGRGRPGVDLGPRLDAAALGGPRADAAARPASRCGRGRTPWPTTPRSSSARPRAPAVRAAMQRDRRDPRRRRIARHRDERGIVPRALAPSAFGALDPARDRSDRGRGRPGARRAVRPGQPVDLGRRACCAGCTTTGASSTTGSWSAVERSSPSSTSAPSLARPGRAGGRDARAGRRTSGSSIPAGVAHGFLALEPLELLYLVTNEYDGSDELGFAWDDPAGRRSMAGRSARPRTAGRSCPIAIARTRRSPSSSRRCAADPDRCVDAPPARSARQSPVPPDVSAAHRSRPHPPHRRRTAQQGGGPSRD